MPELEEAKEAYVNSFVFSFTSASSIVARPMDLEYDGLPKDWLQQIRDKVVKLTKEDIQRAAKMHFNPDRLRDSGGRLRRRLVESAGQFRRGEGDYAGAGKLRKGAQTGRGVFCSAQRAV